MITGELKNKIDGLWDIFAAGGLVNPLEVIEQITYLMFIHDLDDSDKMTLFFWSFSKPTPAAYGDSQARGLIRAVAAGLCHSHSNARSELQM